MHKTPTAGQKMCVDRQAGGLLVSAAAGSGKTKVLVDRLLSRVTHGDARKNVDEFLVITYTRAAASELRSKILDALNERIAGDPSDTHNRRQSLRVYRAPISTIHGFCTGILREYAHVIGISPSFRVADEDECGNLKAMTLERVMEERYENPDIHSGFYRLVDTLSAGRDDKKLTEIVLSSHTKIQSHAYPERWVDEKLNELSFEGVTDAGETAWGKIILGKVRMELLYHRPKMQAALGSLSGVDKLEEKYGPSFTVTVAGLRALMSALDTGWDAARAAAAAVEFPRLGTVTKCPDPGTQEAAKAVRAACKDAVEKAEKRLSDSSSGLLEDIRSLSPVIAALFGLVRDFDAAYAREKERRAVLDYSDLEKLALKVLVAEDGAPTEAAREIASRYCEVMVDEYQDVNEKQELILNAISGGGDRLFMVGDVKQSIYRFRLADPTIFLSKYNSYPHYVDSPESARVKITLSDNFRSRAGILAAVNYVFENIMSESFGEMDYGGEERLRPGLPYPENAQPEVELDVVDLDSSDEDDDRKGPEVEAELCARRIGELINGGGSVTENGELRPARASDIVILMRSPGKNAGVYASALTRRGIPVSYGGDGDFFSSIEINVMLSCLAVIDNPRQDVPLISVLRSPLCGFDPDRLAKIRSALPDGDFYEALIKAAETDGECRAFVEELHDLRLKSADMSADKLIWHIYVKTGLPGLYAAMDGGERRRRNLLRLYDYARGFEGGGFKGLFAFSAHLRRMIERGVGLSTGSPAGGESVTIMSIHSSKGLEFPIVVLADCAHKHNLTDLNKPVLIHPGLGVGARLLDTERMVQYPTLARNAIAEQLKDEQLSEELRLLYVGMTRAREKLIMLCTYKSAGTTLKMLGAGAALPAEPAFLSARSSMADWILIPALLRPEAAPLREAAGITPVPCGGDGHTWDIRLVGAQELVYREPEENTEAFGQEADAELVAEIERTLEWEYPHATSASLPSKLTATELKAHREAEPDAETSGAYPRAKRAFRRPNFVTGGAALLASERGTALHLAMQYLDYAACGTEESIRHALDGLSACGKLTLEEAKSVDTGRLLRFFKTPLGVQLLGAGDVKREFRFMLLMPASEFFEGANDDEVLVQGVADCFFDTPEGLVVVDFKTDRVEGEGVALRAGEYRPQLDIYARALARISGRPVYRRLIYFFWPETEYELD